MSQGFLGMSKGMLGLALSALLTMPPVMAAPVAQLASLLPTPSAAQPARSGNSFATDTAMADYVFAWAEKTYGNYFAPANPPSQTTAGYYFRFYSGTNTYLAEKDGELWLVMNNSMQRIDNLAAFATQIGYKPGGTGSMTVGKAVATEFMRAIIQWQVDRGQYTDDFGSVTIGGMGMSYGDLVNISVNMEASTIALSCYKCHNWVLSFDQYSEFATELENDTYFTGAMTYMDNGDLAGYTSYTQQMAAQYNAAADSIPSSFSIYWK